MISFPPPVLTTFPLGRVYITAAALRELPHTDVKNALGRHGWRDWGDVCAEDRAANEDALRDGTRLVSSYRSRAGVKFWIITEADRSMTTVLLPADY